MFRRQRVLYRRVVFPFQGLSAPKSGYLYWITKVDHLRYMFRVRETTSKFRIFNKDSLTFRIILTFLWVTEDRSYT